jgi:hypothetical protein
MVKDKPGKYNFTMSFQMAQGFGGPMGGPLSASASRRSCGGPVAFHLHCVTGGAWVEAAAWDGNDQYVGGGPRGAPFAELALLNFSEYEGGLRKFILRHLTSGRHPERGYSVLHPTSERKAHMIHHEKATRPVKLNDEEVSEEIVNDSLGEVTPADSTGLDTKDEARNREHPA